MNNEHKNFYDIEEVNNISIKDVLSQYGIHIKSNGMFKIRNEKTESCKYYENTNSFYDFGSGVGGKPIDLVKYLLDCDFYTATKTLAEMYGIEPISQHNNNDLSDIDYRKIGIIPEKVSANIDFDLDKYTEKQAMALSNRYSFPFSTLKTDNPKMYYKILKTRSYSFLIENKKLFLNKCIPYIVIKNKLNSVPKNSFEFDLLTELLNTKISELNNEIKNLNYSFKLFNKALNKDIFNNIQLDELLNEMTSKDFRYQVGGIGYNYLKEQSSKLTSVVVPIEEYYKNQSTLDTINYSAFLKNGDIKILFSNQNLSFIEKIFPLKKTLNKLLYDSKDKVNTYCPYENKKNNELEI